MNENWRLDIAGLSIRLHEAQSVLAELRTVYDRFDDRGRKFKSDERNPHLCRAGCSHCCKRGAVFAVTLAEAVQWALAIEALPAPLGQSVFRHARALLDDQRRFLQASDGPADIPGNREEAVFSTRVARLNATGPACSLLADELCSVYEDRPMLCRAYGFPIDAYAVESGNTIVFRSLCVLYEGMPLTDYVRAKDLKARLTELSTRLGGGRDWGRFTSPEAILAHVDRGLTSVE